MITPLPFGGGDGGGATIFYEPVCSVLLCNSVRKRILENCRGEFLLSRRIFLSLTELTDLTERFGAHFEPTEGLRHTENTERFS